MSKSNLINSLFKIDAAEGLVRYTNSVKPYHSKLLDVLIEYIYKEDIKVKVTEKWKTDIQQFHTTGDVVWSEADQQFVSVGSACYYQVNNDASTSINVTPTSWRHTWVIEGHHAEKFLAGNRFRVTFADATSKVFIVTVAENSKIVALTDPYITSIVTTPVNADYSNTATTIELAITPDYRIMGAVTSPSMTVIATTTSTIVVDGDYSAALVVGKLVYLDYTSPPPSTNKRAEFVVVSATVAGVLGNPQTTITVDKPVPPVAASASNTATVSGSWIVEGDQRDQFLAGETVVVANTAPYDVGSASFTISSAPTLGFRPGVSVDDHQLADHSPDLSIVGVRPSRADLTTPPYSMITGQWVVLGKHAQSFVPHSIFSVKNEQNTAVYFRVGSVTETTFENLDPTTITPDNSDYLNGNDVTVITIDPIQEIPETATPSGIIQSHVVPQYEIVGVTTTSWIVRGQYAAWFHAGDVVFVDNVEAAINSEYVISSSADNVDGTTTITIVGSLPLTATATGIIQHPSVPVTFIPASEPVFDYWNKRGIYYVPVRTGTLRYTPRVFNQVAEPTTSVWGAIWTNPVTNVSKRWVGAWIHNYTPTNYSWFLDAAPPASVVIESAIAQAAPPQASTRITLDLPIFSTTGVGTPLFVDGNTHLVDTVIDDSTVTIIGRYKVAPGDAVTVTPITGYGKVKHELVAVRQAHTFAVGEYIMFVDGIWTQSPMVSPNVVTEVLDDIRFRFESTDKIPSTAGTVIKRWETDGALYGAPYTFTVTATEYITEPAEQGYGQCNSFLVKNDTAFTPYSFTTISTKANQLMFSTPYNIVGVDHISNKWVISGTTSILPGDVIYVTGSTAGQGIGHYVVVSTLPGTALNTTDVFVVKQISRLATPDGILAAPTAIGTLPRWVEGTRVSVSSSVDLPDPLVTSQPYYFIPVIKPFNDGTIETPATFALSKVRKPRDWTDYIDITTLGSGVLSITQDETYVPGTKVFVRDTHGSRNNGTYTILQSTKESSTRERIFVEERIGATTPAGAANDGVMVYNLDSHVYSSLTEKVCKAREQSGLYADTHITELLEFSFTMEEFDFVMAKLAENEPRNEFLRELGFDIPEFDGSGFDGDYVESVEMSPMYGSSGGAYALSMMEIGFDTQFFDVGGIDETTRMVAKKYGHSVPPPPQHTVWDADYRRRERSVWDNRTSPWDINL